MSPRRDIAGAPRRPAHAARPAGPRRHPLGEPLT
jgi:hypothetical protein